MVGKLVAHLLEAIAEVESGKYEFCVVMGYPQQGGQAVFLARIKRSGAIELMKHQLEELDAKQKQEPSPADGSRGP